MSDEPVAWRYKTIGSEYWNYTGNSADAHWCSGPRKCVETLYASPQPVAIKELEWRDDPGNDKDFHTIHANPPLAYYQIWWFRSGPYWLKQSAPSPVKYDTLDLAKAAAQADYDRRIRTALAIPQGDMVLAWTLFGPTNFEATTPRGAYHAWTDDAGV